MSTDFVVNLSNFRAFAETGPITVRPLTFLVGENSTGKTSFLAALRYCFNLSDPAKGGYFNAHPFDLGAYEDIVHQSGASSTTLRFSIEVTKRIDINKGGSIRIAPDDEEDIRLCTLKIYFGSRFGEVSLKNFRFSFDDIVLEYDSAEKGTLSVMSDGRALALPQRERSIFSKERLSGFDDLRSISYRIFDHAFAGAVGKAHKRDMGLISDAAQAFDSFITSTYHLHTSPPVRSVPRRVYTSSDESVYADQTHAPHELNRLKRADRNRWARLNAGLTKFGKLSGLFTKFDVTKLTRQDAGPFQLKVTVRGRPSNIADVGYGVSQSLPIMTDLIESTSDKSVFLFQQPEVHLHPKAQASLGTVFTEHIARNRKSYLIAETHSDFLIDRARIEIREGRFPADLFSILFFEAKGNDVSIHEITSDEQGNLVGCPPSYRTFFIAEQEKVLGL